MPKKFSKWGAWLGSPLAVIAIVSGLHFSLLVVVDILLNGLSNGLSARSSPRMPPQVLIEIGRLLQLPLLSPMAIAKINADRFGRYFWIAIALNSLMWGVGAWLLVGFARRAKQFRSGRDT